MFENVGWPGDETTIRPRTCIMGSQSNDPNVEMNSQSFLPKEEMTPIHFISECLSPECLGTMMHTLCLMFAFSSLERPSGHLAFLR